MGQKQGDLTIKSQNLIKPTEDLSNIQVTEGQVTLAFLMR